MKLTEIYSLHFDYISLLRLTHLLDIVDSASGLYEFKSPDRLGLAWFNFKQLIAKPLLSKIIRALYPFSLGVEAFGMTKKS